MVEQIPGLTISGDQTGELERGYWPSYNVPFYREVHVLISCGIMSVLDSYWWDLAFVPHASGQMMTLPNQRGRMQDCSAEFGVLSVGISSRAMKLWCFAADVPFSSKLVS